MGVRLGKLNAFKVKNFFIDRRLYVCVLFIFGYFYEKRDIPISPLCAIYSILVDSDLSIIADDFLRIYSAPGNQA